MKLKWMHVKFTIALVGEVIERSTVKNFLEGTSDEVINEAFDEWAADQVVSSWEVLSTEEDNVEERE